VEIRLDPENLARTYPTEVGMVADLKLALAELNEEVHRQSDPHKLARVAAMRLERAKAFRAQRAEILKSIARDRWDNAPISGERLAVELEAALENDFIVVSDNDTYQGAIDSYMTFGPGRKDYFGTGGYALGWGLPAAFGVKLGVPNRRVAAIVSDGSFLFGGPQPLWSYSRYRSAILVVVLNNRSYNNERNRIMERRGRSYETGRDMVCYLGDPDVDYAKQASAYGMEGEIAADPVSLKEALTRAKRALAEGRSYLLDVHMERRGSLANSTWHPEFRL
jgi:acetolactate synthase-1/2/3 large subunit